jgi:glutamine synthetase
VRDQPPTSLPSLTEGMFGYSLTRPLHNQEYFYDIFNTCDKFRCGIEGWHTESGPGVFEAVGITASSNCSLLINLPQALLFNEIREMADRAALFKSVALFIC